jgi:signal transduction histidine kinase
MLLSRIAPAPTDPEYELAAEAIAVKIRWFGLVVGGLLVNFGSLMGDRAYLNAILLLGLAFTVLDTFFFRRGRVFLKDYPLVISAMEALFIALLCRFETGLDSPFRYYYLLSLICCAIRYTPWTTYITCALDGLSYSILFMIQPAERDVKLLAMMLVVLAWVAWAASALAKLLKETGARLRDLNATLESRIAERTAELQESQAQVLHQEKMAGFGLLAAGIAHEVGNPLTSISSLVQMLERRELDDYSREKLAQVNSQLMRIQAILRELVTFSRPASDVRGRVAIRDVIDEALGIAKFYKGGKSRTITAEVPDGLPPLVGVRDQLVQVVFNLVINAVDATGKGGCISVRATQSGDQVTLEVRDDGCGIPAELRDRIFRPYFTTKKQGTGLGLFVSRKIIEEHGGTMAVESEPGLGTAFRIAFELPA